MDEEQRKKIQEETKKKIEELTKAKLAGMGAIPPGVVVGRPAAIGSYIETPAFGLPAYRPNQLPHAERPYIMTVELLDDGMVLRYSYPVKRTVTIPGRPGFGANEPAIQLFFEGIAEAIDGGGEDWNEESRKNKFAKMFEKMRAISAPKKVEQYFFETRSCVCKNAAEIETATKAAREAAKLTKELQDSGEVIRQGGAAGHIGPCFDGPIGEAYIGGPDYTLGA